MTSAVAPGDKRVAAVSRGRLTGIALALLTGRSGAWLFTAAVWVAALVVFLVYVVPLPGYVADDSLPWPAFAVAFALAEVAVVHLRVRNQAVTVSLSEIPLVVGFYFVVPAYLVVAQFVGAAAALVVHRRQPPLKLAFNLAIFSLGSSLGLVLFRAIVPPAPTNLIVWWGASFAGAATVVAVSAPAIALVISLSVRSMAWSTLRQGLAFGLATAFVNTSIAMLAVSFIDTEPNGLWLLSVPAGVGLLGYRAFSAQRVRQARLEFLYDCTEILQGTLLDEAVLVRLLLRVREMFRGETVEVILADPALSRPASRVVIDSDSRAHSEIASPDLVAARRAMLLVGGGGRLLDPKAPTSGTAGGGMIVLLQSPRGVEGTLMVAGRLDDLVTFGNEDVRALETLGSRLSLVAENSGLVERLAESLAEVTQLAAIVQSSDDAIIAVAADGTITSWNPAATRLFGYEAAEMIGRMASEALPEGGGERLWESFNAVLSGATTRSLHTEWRRSDAVTIPVSIAISPVRGIAGETTGVSAIVRDESDRFRAEAAALASADELRTVVDASPIGMGIAGEDLRWAQANPALCAMLGLQATETLGRRVVEMIHPDDLATIKRLEDRLFDGEPAVRSVERRYVASNGGIVWTAVTARLIHEPSSHGPMALYMIEDITERRYTEERARLTEERFRHATLAISAIQDPTAVIPAVLRSARETLGAQSAAIATYAEDGTVVEVEFDGVDAGATFERIGRWPSGHGVLAVAATSRSPLRLRDVRTHPEFQGLPEGHPPVTSFLGVPIPYVAGARSTLYVANKLDGGEFTEGDEAIAVALANHAAVCLDNARINAQARELVGELDRANTELVRMNDAKTQFLANVAHELRTPLHAILVSSELVHDSPVGQLSGAKIRDFGATIQSSGRLMVRLIDDLVDLSRIEAGRLDLRPTRFRLGDLLAEIAPSLRTTAQARGIELEIPEGSGPLVEADPVRLRQILSNLIGNALKFTERGGRIWVEIGSSRTEIAVLVHDTGIGIAPEDLERAFLPFEQVSRTSTPGAGLGLAIARSLAELHGGRLEVSSTLGEGSTFALTLPRRAEATVGQASPAAESLPMAGLGGGRPILVVEDDPTALSLATEILEMVDYEVWKARSLAEAREQLRHGTPALVLLDLRLGDGNGVDLAEDIRADETRRNLPILVLSADATPEDAKRVRAAGCNGFLSKPVGPRILLSRISELISSAEGQGGSGSSPAP